MRKVLELDKEKASNDVPTARNERTILRLPCER